MPSHKPGAKPQRGNGWLCQEQLDELRELFLSGASAKGAARQLGCSSATAWKYYKRLKRNESMEMVARDPHMAKPRYLVKEKIKKPLNNPARFYQSSFEPT